MLESFSSELLHELETNFASFSTLQPVVASTRARSLEIPFSYNSVQNHVTFNDCDSLKDALSVVRPSFDFAEPYAYKHIRKFSCEPVSRDCAHKSATA